MVLDYYDYKEVLRTFWKGNIKQDYGDFDFIKAFDVFDGKIKEKLAEHGLLSFEEFKDYSDGIYDYEGLGEYAQCTDHIQITREDLEEVIIKYKYERNKEQFEDYDSFIELGNICEAMQEARDGGMDLKEKVLLFDRIIHAEHETGLIFEDDFDLDKIREEFEEEFNEKTEVCL